MQLDNLTTTSWFQVSENIAYIIFFKNVWGKSVHKKQKFEKYSIKLDQYGLPRFLLS